MKRFDIITEADARTLDHGATVELAPGGHVTPLAKDTLAARRVTVAPWSKVRASASVMMSNRFIARRYPSSTAIYGRFRYRSA